VALSCKGRICSSGPGGAELLGPDLEPIILVVAGPHICHFPRIKAKVGAVWEHVSQRLARPILLVHREDLHDSAAYFLSANQTVKLCVQCK